MVETRGELVSASENCIGLDSSSTSLKHQLPLHPSGRQRHTQATNDQANGGQFGSSAICIWSGQTSDGDEKHKLPFGKCDPSREKGAYENFTIRLI